MTFRPLTPPSTLPTLITVIACTIPHFPNISLPIIFICLSMWAYIYLNHLYTLPMPGRLLRMILGTGMFITAIALNEGLTIEAFVALLTMMISLKMFELDSLRDQVMTIILCYFLIVSCMFFDDSLFTFLYILLAVLITTSNLIKVNFRKIQTGRALKLSAGLLLKAVPIMVLLFFLFPRVQGGFWGRPPLQTAKSGFTDEISFGTISRLVQDTKPVFRVVFTENAPPREQLYWRGIVLVHFDGRTWRREKRRGFIPTPIVSAGTKTNYTITLEPHNQHYLFALDLPSRVYTSRAWGRHDHTWYRWRPITSRLLYTAESHPSARPTAKQGDARTALQLPQDGNEKTRQFARSLRAESDSSREYLEKVLTWLSKGNFSYTLFPQPDPSVNTENPAAMDHFLFSSREGFCEHYASALAYLMRAGGVPARLVGGFLGGSRNPYGDYLVIRGSDAHVWCEVLLDDNLWHRVDPTLTVVPGRAAESAADLIAALDSEISATFFDSLKSLSWIKVLSDYRELVNSRWNLWIMGYSRPSQTRLFSRIGIDLQLPGGMVKAGVMTVVLVSSLLFMITAVTKSKGTPRDEVARYWLKFCAKLDKTGIRRLPHQGPMDYLRTIQDQRPDLADEASHIVSLYVALRFSKEHDTTGIKSFTQAIHSFSPSKKTTL